MFAGEPRQDITDAFDGARDVLASIAERSPQAKNYYGILTTMYEAVTQYRKRESLEARRQVQHYMSQLLVVDVAADQEDDNAANPEAEEDSRPFPSESTISLDGNFFLNNRPLGLETYGGDFTIQQQRQQSNLGHVHNQSVSSMGSKQYLSPFSTQDLVADSASSQPPSAGVASGSDFSAGMGGSSGQRPMFGGGIGLGHMTDSILDDLQIDWGDLDLQLGDDSGLFDSGPFEALFYSVE